MANIDSFILIAESSEARAGESREMGMIKPSSGGVLISKDFFCDN